MGQELSKKIHYNTQRCNYKTNSSESIKRRRQYTDVYRIDSRTSQHHPLPSLHPLHPLQRLLLISLILLKLLDISPLFCDISVLCSSVVCKYVVFNVVTVSFNVSTSVNRSGALWSQLCLA